MPIYSPSSNATIRQLPALDQFSPSVCDSANERILHNAAQDSMWIDNSDVDARNVGRNSIDRL